MPTHTLAYQKTAYFSKLMCDYLDQDTNTLEFYGHFPLLENFEPQIQAKQAAFSLDQRAVLVSALKKQYQGFSVSEATQNHLDKLSYDNTYTVTTGHQLNLFTGPLYFLYKIFSVINLAQQLKERYPESDFVPVYWMATEDHDFDEINYFNLRGQKVLWDRSSGGGVGRLDTQGLQEVLEVLKKQWGSSHNAVELASLFENAYLQHSNLADATRYLGNALFSDYGLVIVDGDDAALKQAFVPYAALELNKQQSHKKVSETSTRLQQLGYPEQVHPREINLFYLTDGLRERIVAQDAGYAIHNTSLFFTAEEMRQELTNHPERFSPNALLRPLYQEAILPNLCYTGGGGELAYWFQLKDYFESVEVPFPILLLRNSALILSSRQREKLDKLGAPLEDLFLKQSELLARHTRRISEISIDFSDQKKHLQQQFEALYELAKKTDASFLGAVGAQEKKQLNGLDHLEKRLLRAQKRKLKDQLDRLTELQDQLFPKQSLQERTLNFSELYLEYGPALLDVLKASLNPLGHVFTVVEMES